MIKQVDIFYPVSMGQGWVVVEFRLYRLYGIDSPAPFSKKVTHIPFMREKVLKIIHSFFKSEYWFEIPQVRNASNERAFFSFVSTGKKGAKYNDYKNSTVDESRANAGIGFFGAGVGAFADYERVAQSGLPSLRPEKYSRG